MKFQREGQDEPLMAILLKRLDSYRIKIGHDIINLFQEGFDPEGRIVAEDPFVLGGCCLCADVLENNSRAALIKIFLDKQHSAYRKLFPFSVNVNELKTLSNRFALCKRLLAAYETVYNLVFPNDWQIDILLSQSFGNWIKEDIASILSAVPFDRRVSEDLFCKSLSDANSFDRFLNLRFRRQFTSTVAHIFQEYHYFLFEAKEDQFRALMNKLLPKDCTKSVSKVLKKDQQVLANFDQFFLFFSGLLTDFTHLSTNGMLLVHLSFFVGESLEGLQQYIMAQLDLIIAKPFKKWSADLARLTCSLISTCNYCISTSREIQAQIVNAVQAADQKAQISLEHVQQQFLNARSVAIGHLTARFEDELGKAFSAFSKISWAEESQTEDSSAFFNACSLVFEKTAKAPVTDIVRWLSPETGVLFMERFLPWFVQKIHQQCCKFKIVNEVGAEQLLLDVFAFKALFNQSIPPPSWSPCDLAAWSTFINRTFERYEILLKVLLTPCEPPAPFVQSYLLLLADFDADTFSKLLELKGIVRRSEQLVYLDEFNRHAPPTPCGDSPFPRRHSIQSIKSSSIAWSKYYEIGEEFVSRLRSLSLSSISFKGYSRRERKCEANGSDTPHEAK